jgi:hypothetical protein
MSVKLANSARLPFSSSFKTDAYECEDPIAAIPRRAEKFAVRYPYNLRSLFQCVRFMLCKITLQRCKLFF